MAIQPPSPKRNSFTLADGFALSEAQFLLSDFCIQHFFNEKDLIGLIQNARDPEALRVLLSHISTLTLADKDQPHLAKALASCIEEINSTCS
jgi:hypothetical protein